MPEDDDFPAWVANDVDGWVVSGAKGGKNVWPEIEASRAPEWTRIGSYRVRRLRAGGWAAIWEWRTH